MTPRITYTYIRVLAFCRVTNMNFHIHCKRVLTNAKERLLSRIEMFIHTPHSIPEIFIANIYHSATAERAAAALQPQSASHAAAVRCARRMSTSPSAVVCTNSAETPPRTRLFMSLTSAAPELGDATGNKCVSCVSAYACV